MLRPKRLRTTSAKVSLLRLAQRPRAGIGQRVRSQRRAASGARGHSARKGNRTHRSRRRSRPLRGRSCRSPPSNDWIASNRCGAIDGCSRCEPKSTRCPATSTLAAIPPMNGDRSMTRTRAASLGGAPRGDEARRPGADDQHFLPAWPGPLGPSGTVEVNQVPRSTSAAPMPAPGERPGFGDGVDELHASRRHRPRIARRPARGSSGAHRRRSAPRRGTHDPDTRRGSPWRRRPRARRNCSGRPRACAGPSGHERTLIAPIAVATVCDEQ